MSTIASTTMTIDSAREENDESRNEDLSALRVFRNVLSSAVLETAKNTGR